MTLTPPIIATIAERPDATANDWFGFDLAVPSGIVRICAEDGDVELIVLDYQQVLLWQARFANGTPNEIIVAALNAALKDMS